MGRFDPALQPRRINSSEEVRARGPYRASGAIEDRISPFELRYDTSGCDALKELHIAEEEEFVSMGSEPYIPFRVGDEVVWAVGHVEFGDRTCGRDSADLVAV